MENNNELILTRTVYAKEYTESTASIGEQYSSFTVNANSSRTIIFFIHGYVGTPWCRLELNYNTTKIARFDVNGSRQIINIV